MKTKYMISKVLKVFALVTMALTLANCSKDSGGGGGTTTTGTYQLLNNICYQNVNGTMTQVATSYCTSGTGTYQMINNICYQNVNGQLIQQSNTALCTNSGTGSYQMINNICYQNINGQLIQQSNTALCYNSGVGGTRNCNGQSFMHSQYGYVTCGYTISCSGMQVNDPAGTYTCQ